jgi:hypothetical protein
MNKPLGLLGGPLEIQQGPTLSDSECAAILLETGVDPLLVELFQLLARPRLALYVICHRYNCSAKDAGAIFDRWDAALGVSLLLPASSMLH